MVKHGRPATIRVHRGLVEGVEYALERSLPTKGTIYAKLGDMVKPETVVGEAKVSAGRRVFDVAQELGVHGHQVVKYLHRTIGARVYEGDVVAEAPAMFGFKKRQFISPIDGVIQQVDEQSGQLTMQFAPVTFRLPAGVRGEVAQIVPDEAVFVKTRASILFGTFGSGKMREGALRLVAEPTQVIQSQAIDSRLAGYVIGGGSGITRDALNRALAVGVKAIITGGMTAHELLAISGELNGREDIGLSLIISSGLGVRPMDSQTYAFLEAHQEQQVFVLPQEKRVVIPLPWDNQMKVEPLPAGSEAYVEVESGDRVRVLAGRWMGEVAELIGVGEVETIEGTRLRARHCLLRLNSGDTIKVPLANLEIIA